LIDVFVGENVVEEGKTLKVKRVTDEDLGIYGCFLGDKMLSGYDVDISFRLVC
jgi:hypothetical protein